MLVAKDQAEAFLMLETGRAAAYVLNDVQLAVAIARSKDPSAYIISEEAFSKAEPYGIMLRKDDAPFKTVADRDCEPVPQPRDRGDLQEVVRIAGAAERPQFPQSDA